MSEHSEREHERRVEHLLERILKGLELIYNLLNKPTNLAIEFINKQGEATMDVTLVNSPTASALGVAVETNADGSPFTPDPTKIVWSVEDQTVLSFTPNADGTCLFKPLKVGVSKVGVSDSATGLSAVATATVTTGTGGGPTTMEIQFKNITP